MEEQAPQRGLAASRRGSNAEELLLLEKIRRGDAAAFEALYRLYHPRLTNFVMKIVRRPHLVEEVLNDTMMAVWQKPDSFQGSSKLSTWIFAIAYRKALKGLRRSQDPLEDPDAAERPSDEETPEEVHANVRRRDRLSQAMQQLSPVHRAVVDLTYYHELDYGEIAGILDCPVGTVKTRMFHARRRLREVIGGDLDDWF